MSPRDVGAASHVKTLNSPEAEARNYLAHGMSMSLCRWIRRKDQRWEPLGVWSEWYVSKADGRRQVTLCNSETKQTTRLVSNMRWRLPEFLLLTKLIIFKTKIMWKARARKFSLNKPLRTRSRVLVRVWALSSFFTIIIANRTVNNWNTSVIIKWIVTCSVTFSHRRKYIK